MSVMKAFLNEIQGLNLVDVGCSGDLKGRWRPLRRHINLIGFDPNTEECDRLASRPDRYRSARYLPCALSNRRAESRLHTTRSPYCTSLLQPNTALVNRFFSLGNMFEVVGSEVVRTETLDGVRAVHEMDVDVIKLDAQGVELQILSRAKKSLAKAACVEIEVGFIEGYVGQSLLGDVEGVMRSHGYALFDLGSPNRMPRDNVFRDNWRGEQLIYTETTWLKDYVLLHRQGRLHDSGLDRRKALAALVVCALQGCLSFGYELAGLFRELGLVAEKELEALASAESWRLRGGRVAVALIERVAKGFLGTLPRPLRYLIKSQLEMIEIESFDTQLKRVAALTPSIAKWRTSARGRAAGRRSRSRTGARGGHAGTSARA